MSPQAKTEVQAHAQRLLPPELFSLTKVEPPWQPRINSTERNWVNQLSIRLTLNNKSASNQAELNTRTAAEQSEVELIKQLKQNQIQLTSARDFGDESGDSQGL